MMPSQKFGSDWPEDRQHGARVVVAGAPPHRGHDADATRRTATVRTMAASVSWMVAGSRSPTTREGGGAVLEGLAEVAPEHAPEEDRRTGRGAAPEAELAVQLVDRGLRRALGEQHLRRIAGHDAEDDEDQDATSR